MSLASAPLKKPFLGRLWDKLSYPAQDMISFWLVWIFGVHGILVFAFSWILGLVTLSGNAFGYAWNLTLASFFLSLPAVIDSIRRNLNFTDLALEYAGWGYLGGAIASVLLLIYTAVWWLFNLPWPLTTAVQGATFVTLLAFLAALIASGFYFMTARPRKWRPK